MRAVPRVAKPPPYSHLAEGTWPHGELRGDAPTEALQMQILSRRLRTLLTRPKKRSVYSLAKDAELPAQTIHNILKGKVWPDLVTIHRLEMAVRERLWVNRALGTGIEDLLANQFSRRDGPVRVIGFVDQERDHWRMEVIAPSLPDSWRWSVFVLTDEGWTRDRDGTADSADSAERGAEQHIADRIAEEASQPDEDNKNPPASQTHDEGRPLGRRRLPSANRRPC